MKTGQTNGFICPTGSEDGVRSGEPAHLFVFVVTEHLADLWVDQMRARTRKATHLNVSEIIVIRLIIRPSLDVVACVGAAVEKGRHDLALLFFLAVLE
jgi:hypothetical protein